MIWKNKTEFYMLETDIIIWVSERPNLDDTVYFCKAENRKLYGTINISDLLPINDTAFRTFVIQIDSLDHVFSTPYSTFDELLRIVTADGYYD